MGKKKKTGPHPALPQGGRETEAPLAPAVGPAPEALRKLPLIPLRDDVVFPKLIVPLSVGRRTSIAGITTAMDRDKQIFLVAQKDPQIDDTLEKDLYAMGTIAEINGMRQTPAGVQMLVGGVQRARIARFTQFKPFIEVEVEPIKDQVGEGLELEAHLRSVKSLYEKYVESGAAVAPEVAATVQKTDDAVYLADLVSAAPDQTLEQKQHMLETPNVLERLRLLALFLSKQVEILELKAKIQNEVQSTIGKLQREQILREQLKAIRKELGEDEEGADLHNLREKIETAGMPDAVKERALKVIRDECHEHEFEVETGGALYNYQARLGSEHLALAASYGCLAGGDTASGAISMVRIMDWIGLSSWKSTASLKTSWSCNVG